MTAHEVPSRVPTRVPTRIVLPLVILAGAVILGGELTQAWFAHDEGALGQSAERILAGQVPHRDFEEIYTGLLSYLNAAVFSVLPVGSIAMRVPLFIASLGWLVALYRILCRFVPPVGAGVAAVTILAWSVPNYPAPMPSWYIVFLTTVAALALLRWHEDGRTRWLVTAGVMAGFAFLFKLTGVLLLLGAGLALLAVESPATAKPSDDGARTASRGAFAIIIAAVLVLATLLLARIGSAGDAEFLRFVVPTGVLSIAIAWRTLRPSSVLEASRWRSLVARLAPFLLGAAAPVILYLAVQAALGALPALVQGVFITPFRRIDFASVPPPSIVSVLFAAPLMGLFWLRSTGERTARLMIVLVALVGVAALVLSANDSRAYQLGWLSAWGLLFFVALEGARIVLTRDGVITSDERRGRALLLTCLAVSGALVEFPFASPIYVIYGLPLVMLAAIALIRVAQRVGDAVQSVVLLGFLAFALLRVVPAHTGSVGLLFVPSAEIAPIDLPRGGLRVLALEAVVLEDLVPLVQQHAAGGAIWAGPDAPEIYFYTGIANRTRTLFDFLDDPAQQSRSLVERVSALDAAVVVIKLRPNFSTPVPDATVDSLRVVYPHSRTYPYYLVLWR